MASDLVRTHGVTVSDVLDGHKLLEIDCADRVFLTLPVPNLVLDHQVVSFLTEHEHYPILSPALLERRGQAFRRRCIPSPGQRHPGGGFRGQAAAGQAGVLAGGPWPERSVDARGWQADGRQTAGRQQPDGRGCRPC
jgi:hypothetical protein